MYALSTLLLAISLISLGYLEGVVQTASESNGGAVSK
jgi:hypothetical protein